MIFSLSGNHLEAPGFSLENTDIFCFFSSDYSIKIPESHWLYAVCASLKLKKNVLILERSFEHAPNILSTQRWHVGEEFLWLAPRACSVLLEAPKEISGTYQTLKMHLVTFK